LISAITSIPRSCQGMSFVSRALALELFKAAHVVRLDRALPSFVRHKPTAR
jgi:hypothetical protein